MNAFSLINQALGWYLVSAVLALVFSANRTLSGAITGFGGAIASALAVTAGGIALLAAPHISLPGEIAWLHVNIPMSGIRAVWLIAIALPAPLISLFTVAWHRHPQAKSNGLLTNLLMAAAVAAIMVDNLGWLVVMAEIMALCGAFLTGCAQSGKLWFVLGRLGTLLLAFACWQAWRYYGTLDFAVMGAMASDQAPGASIWLPGLAGFGLLAGVIPLHGWAPQAHANASAPAAALFSTVVMKVGLYGMLTVALCGALPPLWLGVLLLVMGMITAFVGGLYALMEHNIQRLLAYHTLENIGIILLGLGAGVSGIALQSPLLVALGFTGGL
ncbi:proton-conducting transporter membrane subunit, partial [Leclercia sp.]|uniref:proton-conducting transporter transmembrane domain-containing protein n=1 Tax=Leclercia sp. TaxID=1898428 RepID=UPI0028A1F2A5